MVRWSPITFNEVASVRTTDDPLSLETGGQSMERTDVVPPGKDERPLVGKERNPLGRRMRLDPCGKLRQHRRRIHDPVIPARAGVGHHPRRARLQRHIRRRPADNLARRSFRQES